MAHEKGSAGVRGLKNLINPRSQEAPELAEALRELERIAAARPELSSVATLQRDILQALWRDPVRDNVPAMSRDAARRSFQSGTPLLRAFPPELDGRALRSRARRVAGTLREHQPGEKVDSLINALDSDQLDLSELTGKVLEGKAEVVTEHARRLGLDPALLSSLLRLALFPALSLVAEQLAAFRVDMVWSRGYCPTCGGWPLLGEYLGLEQTRHLRCGLCATSWTVDRLYCPFCDNRDHKTLGYYAPEGEEGKWRANSCDSCGHYTKMLSMLVPLTPPRLLVSDFASLHLDIIAQERGYLPPA